MRVYTGPFDSQVRRLLHDFEVVAEPVDVGQWQSIDVQGDPSKVTWEIREASLVIQMIDTIDGAQREYSPNLPWAEDHFLERVSGQPHNPPPSQAWWPFAQSGHKEHMKLGKFSHTYPERFWPKYAGYEWEEIGDDSPEAYGLMGIRFRYGDLNDVVARLNHSPYTRQAYLPIWFPEDTGAPENERVPCTLGYHFMVRNNKLHVTYHMRSCDFMRHWRDDVYMAVRLGQWMRDEILGDFVLGELTMHIGSFHIFEGDRAMVTHLRNEANRERYRRIVEALS